MYFYGCLSINGEWLGGLNVKRVFIINFFRVINSNISHSWPWDLLSRNLWFLLNSVWKLNTIISSSVNRLWNSLFFVSSLVASDILRHLFSVHPAPDISLQALFLARSASSHPKSECLLCIWVWKAHSWHWVFNCFWWEVSQTYSKFGTFYLCLRRQTCLMDQWRRSSYKKPRHFVWQVLRWVFYFFGPCWEIRYYIYPCLMIRYWYCREQRKHHFEP